MITKEKLNIYIKYSQDVDAFAQFGKVQEKEILSDSDWGLIDDLIQNIWLLNKNLVAMDMQVQIEQKIDENIEEQDVKQQLFSIAMSSI